MVNNYNCVVLSEVMAKEICSWEYDNEFSVYNFSDWDEVVKNNWDLAIKEKRESEFLGIYYYDNFIAYGRIFKLDSKVFLGVGIKPELCSCGHGSSVMNVIINESIKRFSMSSIYVEVREFNKRAIKCYESIGFKTINKYWKETLLGGDNFILMQLHIDS